MADKVSVVRAVGRSGPQTPVPRGWPTPPLNLPGYRPPTAEGEWVQVRELDPDEVQAYLRRGGLACHMVRHSNYGNRLVIYIEAGMGHLPTAEEAMRLITKDVEMIAPGILITSKATEYDPDAIREIPFPEPVSRVWFSQHEW